MIYITAIIQGIIEGLTEFLPISSTGHLIVSGYLLGFTDERAKTFEIIIQLAAMMAVVTIYFERFLKLIPLKRNNSRPGFSGVAGLKMLAITTIPSVLVGLLFYDFIVDTLFSPITVAIGFAVGGIILIVFEKFTPKPQTKKLDSITFKQALHIGLAQIVSLWPGISRSASTIVGASFTGLDRKTAVEYSFFAAIPVMIGASGLDLVRSIEFFAIKDAGWFLLGMLVSYLTAILAIKFLLKFVENHSLAVFGYYRIALAIVVLLILVI